MDPTIDILSYVKDGLVIGFLALGHRGVWVWKRELEFRDKLLEQKDVHVKALEAAVERWQSLALKTVPILEKTVDALTCRSKEQ